MRYWGLGISLRSPYIRSKILLVIALGQSSHYAYVTSDDNLSSAPPTWSQRTPKLTLRTVLWGWPNSSLITKRHDQGSLTQVKPWLKPSRLPCKTITYIWIYHHKTIDWYCHEHISSPSCCKSLHCHIQSPITTQVPGSFLAQTMEIHQRWPRNLAPRSKPRGRRYKLGNLQVTACDGGLGWTFTPRGKRVDFMGITLEIKIKCALYMKPLALHLHISPH